MKLFLKDKKIQVARIILLLIAGVVLAIGIELAFSLSKSSTFAPLPVWVANAFIIVVVMYAMKWSEP